MMKRILIIFTMLLAGMPIVWAKDHVIKLGEDRVIIKEYPGKGKTYIHVHRNETTALKAAKAVIKTDGGRLITLEHSGGRNIVFRHKGKRYEFDPNRIFTEKGIRDTLRANSHYSPHAAKEVRKLADKIKSLLQEGKVVAVHNNQGYSLKNYLPGKDLAKDAKAFHHNPEIYYRNFFLVTTFMDYVRLKLQGANAVLQSRHAEDDGSLSIYMAKRRYVNIEAGFDQLAEQIEMLRLS